MTVAKRLAIVYRVGGHPQGEDAVDETTYNEDATVYNEDDVGYAGGGE